MLVQLPAATTTTPETHSHLRQQQMSRTLMAQRLVTAIALTRGLSPKARIAGTYAQINPLRRARLDGEASPGESR
jgi:hypothetical protein